jgi:hypothetical protein
LYHYSASEPSRPVLGLNFTLINHGTNWSAFRAGHLSPTGEPQDHGGAFDKEKKLKKLPSLMMKVPDHVYVFESLQLQ